MFFLCSHEEEKSRSLLVSDQLRGRLDKVSKECETVSEERLRLTEDMDALRKKVLQTRREKEAAEREAEKEVRLLEGSTNPPTKHHVTV